MNANISVFAVSSLTDRELLARMPVLVRKERRSSADVIEHLVEIDRRRLFLGQACSSLFAYATERLGYSQDEAHPRVRVARISGRIPTVLDELRNGAIHLTGLFLLSSHLNEDNHQALLAAARGKSRRQIEQLLAEWFPRPDAPGKMIPVPDPSSGKGPEKPTRCRTGSGATSSDSESNENVTRSGTGNSAAGSQGSFRLEPLSPGRYRIEFTVSAECAAKLEQARELLSHAVPIGDLGALIERAVDQLLKHETRGRFGSERKQGKKRPLASDSRHIPVEVARQVWQRDGGQCTFVDEQGRRCGARCFLTLEHRHPFALGGPATVENICLLCKSHNELRAREVFGEEHIEAKRAEREKEAHVRKQRAERESAAEGHPQMHSPAARDARSESGAASSVKQRSELAVYTRVLCGLKELGFGAKEAEGALGQSKWRGTQASEEQLLREALSLLVSRGKG